MDANNDIRSQWSADPLIAELERSLLFSQAMTMSQNAELIHRLAHRVGARSDLADLLSAEANRVLSSIEAAEQTIPDESIRR